MKKIAENTNKEYGTRTSEGDKALKQLEQMILYVETDFEGVLHGFTLANPIA